MKYTRLIGTLATGVALVLPVAAVAPGASASSHRHAAATPSVHRQPVVAAKHRSPVEIARDATRKFHSLDRAKNQGYGVLKDKDGIRCISMPHMGAMGVHYVKGDLVGKPAVRLKQPEALVYDRENGHRRLVALEYVVLKKDWDSVHGKNAPRPRLFGQRFNKTPAGNRFGLPTFYSLHAWIWKHNPDGMFAMWNPNVHCGCC